MTITATKTSWGYACSGASAAQVLVEKAQNSTTGYATPYLKIKGLVCSGSSTASVFSLSDGDGNIIATAVGSGTYGAVSIPLGGVRVDGLKATMVGTSYLTIILE